MGDLFRCFWQPALLAEELPAPDCPPVRVQLLSERLIAFRDTQNRLGLIDEFCAHRRVSLWFGRNEESGLRCPYHGWKYDVFGNCVEVPSEDNPKFCEQIRQKAYPLVEKDGALPVGVAPELHKVRSAAVLLPRDQAYAEAAREHLRVITGKPHASV